ncbi:MAG: ComEA family DNA-binding protein [Negativicutes bacterium]|nr:ComEA family DNA-binding protein [Negativicutes bacterium]
MVRQKKRLVLVIVLALLIVGGSFYGFWQRNTVSESVSGGLETDNPRMGGSEPLVYISGAVSQPGLYKVKPGSRVVDVIEAAGGLAAVADSHKINLAQPVKDGMHVYVPSTPPSVPALSHSPVHSGAAAATAAPAAAAVPQSSDRSSINTADQSELEKLPGIGPVLAARIIDYRQTNGPFHEISEIKKVPGIGTAKFQQIKDRITL